MRVFSSFLWITPFTSADECIKSNLSGCLPQTLSHVVNTALNSGKKVDLSGTFDIASTGEQKTETSPNKLTLTATQCAEALTKRLNTFSEFELAADGIWTDLETLRIALNAVQEGATEVQTVETGYGNKLTQGGDLFETAAKRVEQLETWLNGQKVIRNQLTDLFTELDGKVLETNKDVLMTSSTIRDKLFDMQKIHDHATDILISVGDAETMMYEWAYNVSQTANRHTVDLVSVAQTLQTRTNQVNNVKESNTQLNWIVSQLATKYGKEKLIELNKQYDAGTLSTPAGLAQGPESSSKTGGNALPEVSS